MTVWQSVTKFDDKKASYNLFVDDEEGNTTHMHVGPTPVYNSYSVAMFEGQHKADYYNRFVNIDWALVSDKQWRKV